MTRTLELTGYWLGLCRKAPVIRSIRADTVLPTKYSFGSPPGSSGGKSGSIWRGIGSVISGMRLLNTNRQILWFSFVALLVLAGNTVAHATLRYIEYNLHVSLNRIAWQFLIEFATLFCLMLVLAALFMSISLKKEGTASFLVGFTNIKRYIKPIFLWSLVLTLASMLIAGIFMYLPFRFSDDLGFLYRCTFGQLDMFFYTTLSTFPLNLTGLPPSHMFTEIPGYQERSLLLWFYPGFEDTLIFSTINLLLLVMTPFVLPHLTLGQKSIRVALAESFAMTKKIWVEITSCILFLGVIVSGIFLMHLPVQGAYRMVTPLANYYRPTDIWLALGFLYDLALIVVAIIAATVGGLAILNLYHSAKTGQKLGFQEP